MSAAWPEARASAASASLKHGDAFPQHLDGEGSGGDLAVPESLLTSKLNIAAARRLFRIHRRRSEIGVATARVVGRKRSRWRIKLLQPHRPAPCILAVEIPPAEMLVHLADAMNIWHFQRLSKKRSASLLNAARHVLFLSRHLKMDPASPNDLYERLQDFCACKRFSKDVFSRAKVFYVRLSRSTLTIICLRACRFQKRPIVTLPSGSARTCLVPHADLGRDRKPTAGHRTRKFASPMPSSDDRIGV